MQAVDPEKLDELALRRRHIRVHQNADRAAGAHGLQQPAAEVVLMHHVVAVQTSDPVDVLIQAPVVESPDDHAHGMPHQRVVEAGKLPRAKMSGDDENAFAARLRIQVVFQALGAHPVAGVLRGVAGHAAELDELPAEMDVDAPQDFFSGFGGELLAEPAPGCARPRGAGGRSTNRRRRRANPPGGARHFGACGPGSALRLQPANTRGFPASLSARISLDAQSGL